MKNRILIPTILIFLTACNLSPGMYMSTKYDNSSKQEFAYIESIDEYVEIRNISEDIVLDQINKNSDGYFIGNGDQIAITIWGLSEIFPIANVSPDLNLRKVDSNGNIYFPYVGLVKASGKTQDQLRADLIKKLSQFFNSPQLDITIARFNSQKVYMLGEVTQPKKINLTDVPLTLADALGEVKGLSTLTSAGSEVFIVRKEYEDLPAIIYRADLQSPSGFIVAGNFYLKNNDIVYVNAKGTTRWNRIVSQFFPFSSLVTAIDNLNNNN